MAKDAKPPGTEAERIYNWDAEVCTNLMSTPQGRFFIERFLDFCCEGRDLYLNDGDALGMAVRDGLGRAGRWWRNQLEEHCADRFLQMIRERRSRIARAQAEVAAREAAGEPDEPDSTTPIERMADEQARLAEEEAAREAANASRKKPRPEE